MTFHLVYENRFNLAGTSKGNQQKWFYDNKYILKQIQWGAKVVYAFDCMKKDVVCSTVKVFDDDTVSVQDYLTCITDLPFGCWGSEATVKDVNNFLETRCFPRTRSNCKSLLKAADIPFYEPKLIIEKTYGVMAADIFWLRPLDSDMTYEKVRKKFGLRY